MYPSCMISVCFEYRVIAALNENGSEKEGTVGRENAPCCIYDLTCLTSRKTEADKNYEFHDPPPPQRKKTHYNIKYGLN